MPVPGPLTTWDRLLDDPIINDIIQIYKLRKAAVAMILLVGFILGYIFKSLIVRRQAGRQKTE